MSDLEIGLCWGTLVQATLPELIEAAGRHGFPTLSVRPDTVLDTIAAGTDASSLRKRMRDLNVRVRVIDAVSAGLPGGRAPSSTRADAIVTGSAQTCLEIAEALEAPIVNICHYGDHEGGPFLLTEMIDAVGAISEESQRRGLCIVMEFVPATGIPTITDAAAIARGVGMANCGILLDPWHLARTGGTVEDIRALPFGMIGALQLDDRTPPPLGSGYVAMAGRDLPGEGRLPLFDICRAALANNPTLTAEVEVFSAELRELPIDAAAVRVRTAVDAWRAGFEDARRD